jgi:hypothetical protein
MYLQAVFGICSENMKEGLVMDILIETFKATKRGAQQAPTE